MSDGPPAYAEEDPNSPPPPPTATVLDVSDPQGADDLGGRVARMQEVLGLPDELVRDLLKVSGRTEIVVVADDSRSMNAVADSEDARAPVTRWQELKRVSYELVTMLLVVESSEGFWLKFLNDDQFYHITRKEDLDPIFASKPNAYGPSTPLQKSLRPILRKEKLLSENNREERDSLCVVLTDGVPTDCSFAELADIVRSKPKNVYVSFVMCTDQLDVVTNYNHFMDPLPGTDVTDDYFSERIEARNVGNELTRFQWLAKMLLVKFEHFDHLDEKKVRKTRPSSTKMNHQPQPQPLPPACCLLS